MASRSKVRLKKGSLLKGSLPEGCKYCGEGSKLVLLVTGLCKTSCFYCPLSEKKIGADVVYANEKKVGDDRDIIDEAMSIEAEGAGITGGDPLVVIDRTLKCIELLKDEFGEDFHIHLYTASTAKGNIKRLADTGLDELRLHPPPGMWRKMKGSRFEGAVREALKTQMDVGLEIPLLPDETRDVEELLGWADEVGIDFVNLNELEFSETNFMKLKKLGYVVKDDISSGVKGCDAAAKRLLSLDLDLAIHYCTASFKDGVQLRNRLARRAKNVAKEHEVITKDATLIKGVIECAEPGKTRRSLMRRFSIPAKLIVVDEEKNRVEVAPWILEEIANQIDCDCFIVEEYPTSDRLEVERMKL
jgi:pyruvate formate-lyase activating enzyme-like uncharacterized protein